MISDEAKSLVSLVASFVLFFLAIGIGIISLNKRQDAVAIAATEIYTAKLLWYDKAEFIYKESNKNSDIDMTSYLTSISKSRSFYKRLISNIRNGEPEVTQPLHAIEKYNVYWALEYPQSAIKQRKDIQKTLSDMNDLEKQMIDAIINYNVLAKKYNRRITWSLLNILIRKPRYPLLNPSLDE